MPVEGPVLLAAVAFTGESARLSLRVLGFPSARPLCPRRRESVMAECTSFWEKVSKSHSTCTNPA